ncbi:thiamine pyrophosphate-dependent enzyme [Marmoricola sp. URHB0036]|uniref:thiamine pyrophosphate-dependent enzyme n=1 Tax=Marmoricola sp. URHB0036 TaxID=1298863 RepID=UPI0003FF9FDB|nr:thiamine pyrophosphate-dependent enzyme [Marmoricola sp. URHB0036]
MSTVAELLIESIADYGVASVWGVVGDALNPVTDAIRREERIEWVGVRHEEAGAFAASAQAQLTGRLSVCMGTVGPGAIHLLNGLYDAKKSHAPVLAICGQVPREEIGSEFFQEVDNDRIFADVAVFSRTVSSIDQLPLLIEQAGNAAIQESGVAVLTLPGDVGGLDLPKGTPVPRFVETRPSSMPAPDAVQQAASLLNQADKVTLLVGQGAREARVEVLQLAERLAAPMVLTLKAKEGLEDANDYEVGQSGLIGNHATAKAFEGCDVLFLVGTDFPYRDFLPTGKKVIQLDVRGAHIGRRTPVDLPLVGDAGLGLQALLPLIEQKTDRDHLDSARKSYRHWQERQQQFVDPAYDRKPKGLLRRKVDNPESRVRPELLAAAIDRHAASDAVFTTDTGMATVWLSRFVRMTGTRRLVGSFNLGSMANAMPMALGASVLDRRRQVIAFCGDGGISMLLGDLITAVSHDLPVKLVVFDNGRLGMVKLEMEQVGLPEFGTVLHNPDFAKVAEAIGMRGLRVERPDDVDAAVKEALATDGPVLLDVLTNPDEIAVPPTPTLEQGWGFAIAKTKEFVDSAE